MKVLLKIVNIFFYALGVIFFILILLGLYLWLTDPFGIKPLFFPAPAPTGNAVPAAAAPGNNSLLNQQQIDSLNKLGIDTSQIPETISPVMEKCLTAQLGASRAAEIKGGSSITAIDLLKAQSCLK